VERELLVIGHDLAQEVAGELAPEKPHHVPGTEVKRAVLEQARHQLLKLPPAREQDVGGGLGLGRDPVGPERGEPLGQQRIDGVRVAIESADPIETSEAIGEPLSATEVVDAQEDVVVLQVGHAAARQLAGQSLVTVPVARTRRPPNGERTPSTARASTGRTPVRP